MEDDEQVQARRRLRAGVRAVPAQFDPIEVLDQEDKLDEPGLHSTTAGIYRRQWRRVGRLCREWGYPVMPMPRAAVLRVIRWYWNATGPDGVSGRGRRGRRYAPNTVTLVLAVISIVHQWRGYPSPTRHPQVYNEMRRYRRRWARHWQPDIAQPLTLGENISMVATCDLTTVQGVRNAAALRLHYEAACQTHELLALQIHDLSFDGDLLVITFPDQEPPQVSIPADVDAVPHLCPLRLLRRWLSVLADAGYTSGLLFHNVNAGRHRNDGLLSGSVRPEPFTAAAYKMVVRRNAQRAGVDVDPQTKKPRLISPYSNRSGFCHAAFAAGATPAQVSEHTGHSLSSPVLHKMQRPYLRNGRGTPLVVRVRRGYAQRLM